jgi:pilus assembly protein Flp/PilA
VTTAVRTQLARLGAFVAAHRDEDGQGLAEYALIIALIAIVCIVAALFLGSQISDQFTFIGTTISSQAP